MPLFSSVLPLRPLWDGSLSFLQFQALRASLPSFRPSGTQRRYGYRVFRQAARRAGIN